MRVVTGSARGRRLLAPEGLETRPTSGLVKEAVFNMLQFEIEGANVLDLYAGSGQMGIEALSRGAKYCVFVDNAKACYPIIKANLTHTGMLDKARILTADAASYLGSSNGGGFDIAFLDPPYTKGVMAKVLNRLAAKMSESGVIVCETSSKEAMPKEILDFSLIKESRYGKTKVVVYRKLSALEG